MKQSIGRSGHPWVVVVGLVAVLSVAAACGPPPPTPSGTPNPLTLGQGNVLGNADASGASLSADGNWVAFVSAADNLVPGDTNGNQDVFLRNRGTGAVKRIAENAFDAPRISSNGRYVAFKSGDLGAVTLARYDRITDTTVTWTDPPAGTVLVPWLSDDGSSAVYGARSSFGIFTTSCRVYDFTTSSATDCPHGGPGYGTLAIESVSANSEQVLYMWNNQDGHDEQDGRYLWNRTTDTTQVLPGALITLFGSAAISNDGRFIATLSLGATNFGPPVVWDLTTMTTQAWPAAEPDALTVPSAISDDGRWVQVTTEATNLHPDDTNGAPDVYRWDTTATGSAAVDVAGRHLGDGSVPASGTLPCEPSPGAAIPANGAVCVLSADPLLGSDTNAVTDAYRVTP
ncbi:MAG: TolB family protein [Microthrixaceae bacterium]